jgi:two-component system phosphate regulon response regulator PhoB
VSTVAQPRILIIEDEWGLVQSLSWYFIREGFAVAVAGDGLEGLRQAQAELPDVILLDWMLPGLSGLDVCRELRAGEHTRDIPVIIVTARTEKVDEALGRAAGADDYVTKPFSNKTLLARVRTLLTRGQERPTTPTSALAQQPELRQIGHTG